MHIRTNTILEKMANGQRAVGCALVFPSTDLVELIGMAGMGFVYIDGEHGQSLSYFGVCPLNS